MNFSMIFKIFGPMLASWGNSSNSAGKAPNGKLILLNDYNRNQSLNEFSVDSCTMNTVVVSRSASNNNALELGDILVYVNDLDNNGVQNDICSNCSPLFRKIVSKESLSILDDTTTTITYITTMATFAEIFPDEIFDYSLQDEFIEPLFKCHHHTKSARKLADFQSGIGFWTLVGVTLLWIVTPIMAFFSFTTGALSHRRRLVKEVNEGIDGEFPLFSTQSSEAAAETEDSSAVKKAEVTAVKSFTLPNQCIEWKTAHDKNGKCLFVNSNNNCNDSSLYECYHCSESDQHLCHNHDFGSGSCYDKSTGMINIFDIMMGTNNGDYDFSEQCCIHDYCYSSTNTEANIDKSVCDKHVYNLMTSNCGAHIEASSLTATTTTDSDMSFPLTQSDLSSSCQLLPLLYYLSVKLFGDKQYKAIQSEQIKYEKSISIVCGDEIQFKDAVAL